MFLDIIKVFAPTAISFFIGLGITPFLTNFLYKHKMWKKKAGKKGIGGGGTPIFNKLHKEKEVGTPRMGGIIIWASTFLTIILIWVIARLFPTEFSQKLEFVSRNQTWLPIFTFFVGAIAGIVDDLFEIYGKGGLSLKKRLVIVAVLGLIGASWFFFKLGIAFVLVPFVGEIFIGWLFIPFFVAVILLLYSGGVIDGIDGLAGGIFAIIFSAYGIIAFFQNQIDLAAFCLVIVGGLLAFLWFNIPPARFYMSETGSMALTTTLAVVAFLTNAVPSLLIIAFPLIATTFSNIIQVGSKKLRGGKKVFLVAPVHHHFEAIGWPSYKITMRYWIVGIICAIVGVVITLMI